MPRKGAGRQKSEVPEPDGKGKETGIKCACTFYIETKSNRIPRSVCRQDTPAESERERGKSYEEESIGNSTGNSDGCR